MINAVRIVEKALGDGIKRICRSEEEMRAVSRKSIVAALDMPVGHILSERDLTYRRPGTGMSPMQYPGLLGRPLKVAKKEGAQVLWEDVHD